MPNVEMIDSALQSADGPKTFDELVPLLEDAGYVVETKMGEDMPMDGKEAPEDMGPDDGAESEEMMEEGMDMLEELAPPGTEPVMTSMSGVMRDKARNASKNALEKHKGDYA
jgi:hypothetical protein|tara:strand:+ start:2740 stop:3075 length:336 start_codon:yes stop_codon:yes gene_type:complete